ncbi:MAG: A24 family peptidase [Anaerolineales bacterium]|nr:A24 family peptidase [Anaerolineales bacterium]
MLVLVLLAGWGVGIAVNALADNLPYRRRPTRSDCPGCGARRSRLAWSGLMAAATGQRECAYCGGGAGWRAAVVEGMCVLGAAWLLQRNPQPASMVRDGLILAIYLLIVVIDVEHRLILFAVCVPAALGIGVMRSLDPQHGLAKTLLGGLAGFVSFYLLYLLGGLLSRWIGQARRQPIEEVAFGFGDVMLAGLIGITVGWPGVTVALFLGILAAGLFSLAYILAMLMRRRYTAFLPIPYGPFLVLGAAAVYLGGRTAFERLIG